MSQTSRSFIVYSVSSAKRMWMVGYIISFGFAFALIREYAEPRTHWAIKTVVALSWGLAAAAPTDEHVLAV